MRTITFFVLSIMATSLGACASIEEDEAVLRSWIGSSDKEVWARYGKPYRVVDDQGWRQWYYEFSRQTTTNTPMSNGRGGTWLMPITVTHVCSFGFILDPKNNVADVGVKNTGCEKRLLARSSKDIPPNALMRALTGKSE
jgi:hypothetical protein